MKEESVYHFSKLEDTFLEWSLLKKTEFLINKRKGQQLWWWSIKVEMRHAGQVAYVSNSTNTVIRGTMSAGRIYDKILDEDYAQIKFYNRDIGIAKILTPDEIDELKKDPENDLNFI